MLAAFLARVLRGPWRAREVRQPDGASCAYPHCRCDGPCRRF